MTWLQVLLARVRGLFFKRQQEQDLNDEIQFHLDMQIEENLRQGMSPTEARYQAQRQFGGIEQVKETYRTRRSLPMVETTLQDLRYGLRMLGKHRGFTAIAVLTLALGIGANTAIFSIINSLLLKPLPFPDTDRLVLVLETEAKNRENWNIVSAPNFQDWQRQNDIFDSMALFDSAGRGYNLSGDGEPERVSGLRVSASFFDVLGVKPRLGRTFLPSEDTPGNHQVVVLSNALWRTRYNSDPELIGKQIRIDDEQFTVIGVMPPEFQFQLFSAPRMLWVPINYTKGDHDRDAHSFIAIARLKSQITVEQARARMHNIGLAIAQQNPKENNGMSATVFPFNEFSREDQRSSWLTLLTVAGFVLLIACINVANLLMARGATRQRELAIRAALGAGRARIMRQLLTESLLLAAAGGVTGTLLAIWCSNLLLKVLPENLRTVPFHSITELSIDIKVLVFTWSITVITGIIFGLAPAVIFSRRDVNEFLQEGSRGSTGNRVTWLRQGLIMFEVALALIVLTGAGLLIQSMWRLVQVAPGLDLTNLLVMTITLPQENLYYGPPGHPQFTRELQAQVGSLPGVVSVSAVSHLPIGGGQASRGFVIEGKPDPDSDNQPGGRYNILCPNYFHTMGIKLISGREFTEQDSLSAPGVIMINEAMAKRFWPNEDPLGQRIKIGSLDSAEPWLTIVGIAQDVKQGGLDRQPRPELYRPYQQAAWPIMTIVARTATTPETLINPIKQALLRIEPDRPVSGVTTMARVIHDSLGSRRFPMLLLLSFSFIALTLAAVGISGVISFSVSQRTREIGIRMALGASKGAVIRLVLKHMMIAVSLGIVFGVLGSLALTRFLTSFLYEVKPMDPIVITIVTILLLSVSIAAGYLPARRAARIDPLTALRCE